METPSRALYFASTSFFNDVHILYFAATSAQHSQNLNDVICMSHKKDEFMICLYVTMFVIISQDNERFINFRTFAQNS